MVTIESISYEKHNMGDPNFPITFHFANYDKGTVGFYMHWHEHLEFLYFVDNGATVILNNSQVVASKGDVVVVNSNCMHSMLYKPLGCRYHCLIIDKLFFDSFFAPLQEIVFNELINDKEVTDIFKLIADEMYNKKDYYKQTVKAYVSMLLSILSRKHSSPISCLNEQTGSQKLTMVKSAIDYISIHYKENISIDDIISYVGFSKYYFCHTFREVTGQTAFDYINVLRCNQAKKLIMTGKYNISESALMSGFNNFSYFTRTYKKHMGVLPSQDIK